MILHPRLLAAASAAALFAAGAAHAGGAFSTPAGAAFSSSCAGLGFSGGGTAGDDVSTLTNGAANCSAQISVIGGVATTSAANSGTSGGVPFANSASSSAGPLAIHLQADNASAVQAAFPAGMANGGFTDQFSLSANGASGTGVWVIPISVTGALDANGLGADALLSVAAFLNHNVIDATAGGPGPSAWTTFNALNTPLYRGSPSGSSWDFENVEWRAIDAGASSQTLTHLSVNDTIFFAVPFTFGQAFDLGIFANVWAGEEASGAGVTPNVASLNFQNTVSWGGPGYVLTNGGDGPAITDFTISSLTGTDYGAPFSEGGGVPEPSSWTLVLLGFFGLGTAIRRKAPSLRSRTAC